MAEGKGIPAAGQAPVEEIALAPGIVFLSGGQSDKQATARLDAMNVLHDNLSWELSFSYARALRNLPMKTLEKADAGNVQAAQKAFYHRLKMNCAARPGSYSGEMEAA